MMYFRENGKRCLYPFNTFTADDEYTCHIRANLPLPRQMQLSKKPVTCTLFITFLESTLNHEHLKKISLVS